jgi:thioredoxin reductase (NADPH)
MLNSNRSVFDADAIILGGGPAGASCALWLKQTGHEPVIIEKRSALGGLQNDSPYPNNWIAGIIGMTGIDYARAIDRQVRDAGVSRFCEVGDCRILQSANGFAAQWIRNGSHFSVKAPRLVIATGVVAKTGGLKATPRIIIGPGIGVEAADLAGKRVAILGGGDNAFENYSFVRRAGAREIKLFARTVRARRSFVESVPITDVRTGPYEADAEKMTVNGEAFDFFIVLYGWQPNIPPLPGLELKKGPDGYIATAPETCLTSLPGVFAIGEITRRAHPCCATAMADGVVAAKAIQHEIESAIEENASR